MINSEKQRIAVVTGGSSGIGAAIALKLAQQGIKVVIADIIPSEKSHENILYRFCNVTNSENVDSLYQWVTAELGEPCILVLNAGIGIHERLLAGDPEKWQQVLDLNIMGALRIIRAFAPLMEKNNTGDIVFVSSVSSGQPYQYGGIYAASKTALDIIAETLRLETAPDIRVSSINAGSTATGFFESAGHTVPEGAVQLRPEDIAEDVWYLLTRPKHASINKIVIRPKGQSF